jgi:peptidoglycan/xylan/chitin deacetylase (PgdA/CDA1 family)
MYHHVLPEPSASQHFPFAVTPALFEEQVAWLARRGFVSVHLADLLAEPKPGPARRVVITFDDGARNLLTHAVPILRKYGMTATFFVPSHYLGGWNCWDADEPYPREALMTAEDLRELHAGGCEIGAHGARHLNIRTVSLKAGLQELSVSKQRLEEALKATVNVMAYPFGEYPPEYAQMCRQSGYLAACAISAHTDAVLDDPFALRRILIYAKDRGWRFRLKLHPLYLRLLARRDRKHHKVQREN